MKEKIVQSIDIKYLNVAKPLRHILMHDLHAIYKKYLSLLKNSFENTVDSSDNFRSRPLTTRMSDLEVMALAVTSETTSIDSENLLFSKLRTDYAHLFPNLIDRTRFNRRRRGLQPMLVEFARRLGDQMDSGSTTLIVDSMPCPVVRNARESSMKICRTDEHTAPRKGWSAVDRRYYIGYKLHMLIGSDGLFHDMAVTPANVHDINFLKDRSYEGSEQSTIIGDRGYISASLQADLFTDYGISLRVPPRKNQAAGTVFEPDKARNRKLVETRFSQLCGQFSIKTNYAKSFKGLLARISSKIAGIAVLQMINWERGRPLNQIKHAWSN